MASLSFLRGMAARKCGIPTRMSLEFTIEIDFASADAKVCDACDCLPPAGGKCGTLQPVEFGPSVVEDGDGGAEGTDAGEV